MSYTADEIARREKEKEIEALIEAFSEEYSAFHSDQFKKLIGSFIRLTPPLNPPVVSLLISMRGLGTNGGESRKPGNITLNWKNLLELGSDVTLAGAGSATSPWLIPFAALYIWIKLWNAASVRLEEDDAFVVYCLWLHRDGKNKISEDDAFSRMESVALKHGRPQITRKKFTKIIDKLLSLECIEMEEGVIWLREWVQIEY